MTEQPLSLIVDSASIKATPIRIPGATPGGIEAQLLNIDIERGIVATIIQFKPGAEIPAHFHENGSEAHYVLEGELIDAGRRYGPGAYLTHAAGVVHGPHRSEAGCRVLTVQGGKLAEGDADFHLAPGDEERLPTGEDAQPTKAGVDAAVPPDMAHEPVEQGELMESQKTAPTPDNPTNPNTG